MARDKRPATLLEKAVLLVLGPPVAVVMAALLYAAFTDLSAYEAGLAIGGYIPTLLVSAVLGIAGFLALWGLVVVWRRLR